MLCCRCQRLEPTWEAFAEELDALEGTPEEIQVDVARVDCVENRNLCAQQRIQAFPTLRLFKDGEVFAPDYKLDRTVAALKGYATGKVALEEKMKEWHPKRRERVQAQNREHPGCMLSGHLDVNRVPGNFHIEARSKIHNLNPTMTNLSHVVHELSFGQPLQGRQRKKVKQFSAEFSESMAPMDGYVYTTKEFHQSYHHFSKVVSTHYEVEGMLNRKSKVLGYQVRAVSRGNTHPPPPPPPLVRLPVVRTLWTPISCRDRCWRRARSCNTRRTRSPRPNSRTTSPPWRWWCRTRADGGTTSSRPYAQSLAERTQWWGWWTPCLTASSRRGAPFRERAVSRRARVLGLG